MKRLLPYASAVLLGLAFSLGDVTRDCALTCNVGYRYAPLAWMAVAAASLPWLALQLRLRARWGPWRWQVRFSLVAALSFVAFRGLTAGLMAADAGEALRYAYLAFYVLLELVFAALAANLFGLAGRLEDPGVTVEKLAAALVAGALGGSWLATLLHRWLGGLLGGRFEIARDHLLVVMALALALDALLVHRLERLAGAGTPEAGTPPRLAAAWRRLRADARLRRLAAFFFLSGVASISLTYVFFWIVAEQTTPNRVDFFARLYVGLNAFSFAFAFFGAERLIRKVGVAGVLLTLPALLVVGTASLAVVGMLWVVLGLRIVSDAISAALYRPATERLLGAVDESVGSVLDGVVARLGEAAGSLLMIVITFGARAGLHVALAACAALNVAWLASTLVLRRTPAQA